MTEMILGCIPCLDGMKQGYTPYENSTVGKCSRCDIEVWVGPEQKKQQETHGYPIVCMRCVSQGTRAGDHEDDAIAEKG